MPIADKAALVTGAGRGFGRALVSALLRRGAQRVYAAVRDPHAVADTFPEPRVEVVEMDVTRTVSVNDAAAKMRDVAIVFSNAAVLHVGGLLDGEGLERCALELETNVLGPLRVARALFPQLKGQSQAAFVQINSIAGLCPFAGVPGYAASKAAVLSLTQGLRRELNASGISLLSVLPGPLRTDMAAFLEGDKASPDAVADQVLNQLESGPVDTELFPDAQARAFWQGLEKGPGGTLFSADVTLGVR